MRELKQQEIEYAITRLVALRNSRGLSQSDLDELSGVSQSAISKIEHNAQKPSIEVLEKLFGALGLQLTDILSAADNTTRQLCGYLATPLTGLNEAADAAVRSVVDDVRLCVSAKEFSRPAINIYWPGEHTHPKKNSKFKSSTVYLIDRSRASTFHFLIILCACPSYGVGQENEIATQAGVPAIRLVPSSMSRMMSGSFIKAFDVTYKGSLEDGISFDEGEFTEALRNIIKLHYRHAAYFAAMNGNDFGPRLKKLIDERSRDYKTFAEDLGVSLDYLQAMMVENLAVSNPSSRLLKRMSVLLGESVGYLLGEEEQHDSICNESKENWHAWIRETPGLDAGVAMEVLENWRSDYSLRKVESSPISMRNELRPMGRVDWDEAYQALMKKSKPSNQQSMFAS
jgi:transcriptional regulator with XRE-family HTH domain